MLHAERSALRLLDPQTGELCSKQAGSVQRSAVSDLAGALPPFARAAAQGRLGGVWIWDDKY